MGCWENFFVGVGFVLLLCFLVPFNLKQSVPPKDLESEFTDFLQKFNKSYPNETTYRHHLAAFKRSIETIDKLNSHRKHNLSAVYGLTKYSDMTPDEFEDKHLQSDLYDRISSGGSQESSEVNLKRPKRFLKNLPNKVDWREKGFVTDVNNQKLCGACWAFSTVQNMETMYAMKTGKLIKLSVQQLIDCARYDNDGCDGGDSCMLLRWMKDFNIKVQTEEEYPLHLRNEQCKMSNNNNNNGSGIQIERFSCQRMVGREEYILSAVAHVGPVAVAINALTWQYYLGGVIQFHCGGAPKLLNHAVQIVGYDLTAEIPHYIVRNSWGADFGYNGYLYIAIGENLCGLANEVSVLTVL